MVIDPVVGRSRAPSRYSKVLLPLPEGPSTNWKLPPEMVVVTPRRARTVVEPIVKSLVSSSISIAGIGVGLFIVSSPDR